MYKTKHSALRRLIKTHYQTKTPLFIYGTFGIGKSAAMKQVAQEIAKKKGKEFKEWNKTPREEKMELVSNPEKYFVFTDKRLADSAPEDIKGLPFISEDKKFTEWKLELWLKFLTNPKADGILFFDEMNLASPSVLASCYQIIHDRVICEESLSPNLCIFGAGNLMEDKAHTFDMPLPLRDRKSEVQLIFDDEEWFNWALDKGIDGRIISFLKFKQSYLHQVDDKRENKSSTPRGWERCHGLINKIDNLQTEEVKDLISVSVGEAAAIELMAFIKLERKVDIEKILNNPKEVEKIGIEDIDLLYSVIGLLSHIYKKEKKKRFEDIVNVCGHMNPEFSVLLLRMMKAENNKHFRENIVKLDIWKDKLAPEYGKYLLGD